MQKIRSLRINTSSCNHAELDEAEELVKGNPKHSVFNIACKEFLPNLNVLEGCHSTDHRHIEAIYKACIN